MKKIVVAISFLLFVAVIAFGVKYSGVFTGVPELKQEIEKDGQNPVPLVKFKDLKGREFTTQDFKGKVLLLNFWASWCGPCIEEFPSMLRLMSQFKDQLVFVAVSSDFEKSDIDSFLKKFRTQYKTELESPNLYIVWDQELGVTQEKFNVLKLPETILVGPDLVMKTKVVGATEWDGEEMISKVRSWLN